MVETTLVAFSVTVFTTLLRNFVFPKFGRMGVQVVVFVLAVLGTLYTTYNGSFPGVQLVVTEGLKVFAGAIALYEVILKQVPLFRKRA